MNLRTIKVTEYKGKKIYIRNFGEIFEYLVILKKELYTAHIVLNKKFLQKEYSKLEFEKATEIIEKMAEATIDSILEK